jgi:chromosomal replication initiation ATPase DnaA
MKMMHPYAYVGCKNFAFQPKSLTQAMKEDLVFNIISGVAKFYDVDKWEILGSKRDDAFMLPRHIAVYLSLQMTGISLVKLGKIFNRHHSTLIHSREYIKDQLHNKSNDDVKEDIKKLKYIL